MNAKKETIILILLMTKYRIFTINTLVKVGLILLLSFNYISLIAFIALYITYNIVLIPSCLFGYPILESYYIVNIINILCRNRTDHNDMSCYARDRYKIVKYYYINHISGKRVVTFKKIR